MMWDDFGSAVRKHMVGILNWANQAKLRYVKRPNLTYSLFE